MKKIKLTRGQWALVDTEDFEWINQWKWYALKRTGAKGYYAARNVVRRDGKNRIAYMHRIIKKTPDHLVCDHLNHDTLDNRKANIRNCTQRENGENWLNQSRYGAGVDRVKNPKSWRKPFRARVSIEKKRHFLGFFYTPEEALAARLRFVAERVANG